MKWQIRAIGWPLLGGRLFAPSGTVFDFGQPDMWTQAAGSLLPDPKTATALDAECWQAQFDTYPEQRNLLGPEPPSKQATETTTKGD
jgi:hypothetical protein